MNNKSKKLNKKLIAGGAVVLGTVLSTLGFPMLQDVVSAAVDTTDKTLYLLNAQQTEVNVGNSYTIKTAYFGKTARLPVGLESYTDAEVTASSVKVTYLSTGKEVKVIKDTDENISSEVADSNVDNTYGTFSVENVGTYRINYSITIDGKVYQMNFDVNGVRSTASMGFKDNIDEVLPKVYDLAYDKVKDGGNNKNITLPLPQVYDANENEVEVKYYTKAEKVENIDTDYVVVSVKDPNGADVTSISHTDGKISILGTSFASNNLGTYTIYYRYYTKAAGETSAKAQCIASTKKEFEVKNGYYNDYKLSLNVAGDVSAFTTGIENNIPTVTATASFKNTLGETTSESVNVKYEVSVKYSNGGSFVDATDEVVDGKFKPSKNGEYKLTYTATDFYGNTAEFGNKVLEASDTEAPKVFIYDASDKTNYVDANITKPVKEYVDASTKLKYKSSKNNIVIYAIGATDNVSTLEDKNITLTRKLVNSSAATIEIGEYNAYNLIFNYDYDALNTVDVLGKALAGKTEPDAKKYLKDNKFLRVVYKVADVDAEDKTAIEAAGVITDKTAENYDVDALKAALVEKGYALIEATHTITGSKSGITYTVKYTARDEAGKESSLSSLTMKVYSADTDFEVTEKPTITISGNFQTSYKSSDKITFTEPKVSSTVDERCDVVTTYQFFKTKTEQAAGEVVLKDEYKVDLSTAPSDAAYVLIKVVATTDYSQSETYEKWLQISNINDNKAPTVKSAGELSATPYKQGTMVTLPTIVYSDDYVAVMNASVEVYHIDATTGERLHKLNAISNLRPNTLNETATFTGEVLAEFAGKYEVLVVANDPANNILTSYYYFTVDSTEQSSISLNVSSAINGDGNAKVGEIVTFDTPTVSYNLKSGNKIYGLVDVDDTKLSDEKTAKYFTIDVTGPSYKRTSETTFVFNKAGKYTAQYTVYAVVYDGTELKLDADKGVYYEDALNNKYYANDLYEGLELVDVDKYNELLDAMTIKSEIYTLNVSANSESKTYEINYGSDEGYSDSYALNSVISLYSVGADADVDSEKSTITVEYSGPTSSSTSYTLKEFSDKGSRVIEYDANGNIKYTLSRNGTYTIRYKIVDSYGNEYTAKNSNSSFTLRVGDTQRPEVGFKDGFLNDTYELNSDPVTLDISKIILTDNGVGAGDTEADTEMRNKLLDTMVVTVSRKDDDGNWIEIANLGDSEQHIYKYKFETAGEYRLKVSVKDEVKWENASDNGVKTFTVSTEGKSAGVSTSTIGIILIVISVLVLVGVIAYFVISRIRMNKKASRKPAKKTDKK